MPASLRGVIWQVVMRVRSKPDALSGQTLSVAEHDCPLKTDCKVLVEHEDWACVCVLWCAGCAV